MLQMLAGESRGIGAWRPGTRGPSHGLDALREGLLALAQPLHLVEVEGRVAVATGGEALLGAAPGPGEHRLLAYVPALLPSELGDPAFRETHGVECAYVAGEMANGIASVDMVEAAAQVGMLGFFGAAGLLPPAIEAAIDRLEGLGERPWGVNLIHTPDDPGLEAATVNLFLRRGVRRVSASAFMDLTLPLVRYRVSGLRLAPDGSVIAPNHVFAKVSRTEVAEKFLSPPPEHFLRALVEEGAISAEQARWAERLPMAEDVTAEADSGGHTDNRPLLVVLPAIQALRDRLHETHGYDTRPRVGAAGGIATPAGVAAAFSMGAAYVMTGSVNQATLEAGTSDLVREMLAGARSTDVAMAAAADMFELGVKLQVLSKGTLFPVRANKLYDLYRGYESLEALPGDVRKELEERYFRCTLEEAWEGCKAFFAERDPAQIERAEKDPRHRMALVFRSYLGRASRWANDGVADRRIDFQVWCGPAMGAFNDWARGSHLEDWRQRRIGPIARNLMAGAAYLSRLAALRSQGIELPAELRHFAPRTDAELDEMLAAPVEPVKPPARRPAEPVRRSAEEEDDAIAVVGLSALFPKAQDLRSYWRLVLHGEDAVGDIPATHFSLEDYHHPDPKARDHTYATRGAFLDPYPFDPTEFGIPPSLLEATDTSQLLALVVARMALEDAGYGEGVEWDRSRAAVIFGVTGTQELTVSLASRLGHPHWRRALEEAGIEPELREEIIERISRSWVEWQEGSFPGLLGNVVAGRVANRLDLGGTNAVVDAACASSLAALHMACMELRTGKADLAISGGVDTLSDIFMHMCFSKTPALSPTGDARPFSDRSDGIVLGEGLGMVVLKRLSDARRDGDRVYALIRSVGTSSDGRARSIYAPLPSGQARALRDAYREAGVDPRSIELLEAHGTGTAAGDAAELEALTKVFREDGGEGSWCALGSVKSQIGHTKAAAGSAGLIKAVLALHHKVLPQTIKVDAPHPGLDPSGPFYLSTEARPWLRPEGHPRRAAVSAFGFGGSNFHAVLEEADPARREVAWDGAVEIAAFSADDAAALERELDTWVEAEEPSAFAARSRTRFRADAAHRLLVVFDPREDRSALAQRAKERLLAGPGSGGGIHYGAGEPPGKVAFLFPGQGSQGLGMLGGLAHVFPEMLASLEAAGRDVARAIYPAPTFDEAEREAQRRTLVRTEVAQPALAAVEAGALEVLRRFGVRADFAAGHSFGELVALHAAGRLDAEALHRLARLRGEAMAEVSGGAGAMLAVHAPLDAIETMLAEERLEVVLANRNGPRQGVLSGTSDAIAAAHTACEKRGLPASRLSVGAAFHSPLVAAAAQRLAEGLREVEVATGALPVIANTTAAPYPAEAGEAKALLADQLAQPVRFAESVERLWAEGVRTFVEVGPRAVLSGLVRQTIDDSSCATLALDAGEGGLRDLAELLAGLAARGHALRLEDWQRSTPPPRQRATPRKRRMTVPISGANYRAPDSQPPPRLPAPRVAASPLSSVAPAPASPSSVAAPPPENEMKKLDPQIAAAMAAQAEALRALQSMQEQTIAAHQAFLEGQAAAQAQIHALLTGQELAAGTGAVPQPHLPAEAPAFAGDRGEWAVGQQMAHGVTAAPATAEVHRVTAAAASTPAPATSGAPLTASGAHVTASGAHLTAPRESGDLPTAPTATATQASHAVAGGTLAPTAAAPQASHASAVAASTASQAPASTPEAQVVPTLLSVVSESTGYPEEMLDLDMDLESDLGIDSIKRVEILSMLGKAIPEAPKVEPERLAELRTLRQVADFVTSGLQGKEASTAAAAPADADSSPQPSAVSSAPAAPAGPETILLDVVAELTGYPVEMLELDMDLESDLGVDSIKRVEILSSLSKKLPDAPRIEPEQVAELRTLRQILAKVDTQASPPVAPAASTATTSTAQAPATAANSDTSPPETTSTQSQPTPLEAAELTLVRLDPASADRPLGDGEVWIAGEATQFAKTLAAELERRGHATRLLPLDAEALAAAPSDAPIAALLLLGSDDASLPANAFLFLQRLAPRLRDGKARIVGVSQRDGAFGRFAAPGSHRQSALAGLVKSAAKEWPEVEVRALDVSTQLLPEEAAPRVADELGSEGPTEVGIAPLERLGFGLAPLTEPAGAPTLQEGDLVVVTGGARGVTARCVTELAKQVKASFLLLGRTPAPEGEEPTWLAEARDEAAIKRALLERGLPQLDPTPRQLGDACRRILAEREIRETLTALEAEGVSVLYREVDARDRNALAAALDEARARFGPVRGIVHGAGVLRDRRIEDKKAEDVDAVYGTKVDGAEALLAACAEDDLRLIAFFTSVSGRFGRRGQADYAMANESLCALAWAEAARREGCRVVSFDWGPWEGGMVTPALAREFTREGIGLIAQDAGARHFATQVLGPAGISQQVVGSGWFDGSDADTPRLVRHHRLDFETHRYLLDHQLSGKAVLPVAMMVELFAQAAASRGLPVGAVEDFRLHKGVVFESPFVDLGVWFGPFADGAYPVELRGADDRVHARALLRLDAPRLPAAPPSPGPLRPWEGNGVYEDGTLFHGPSFHAITDIEGVGAQGVSLSLERSPPRSAWIAGEADLPFAAEPLVLDGLFQAMVLWSREALGAPSLPSRFGTWSFTKPLPEKVRAIVTVRESDGATAVADCVLFDEGGTPVGRLDGYVCSISAGLERAFQAAGGGR